ncbi:nucleotidyltransferase family protein [Phyllobacterium sp. 21LDTY02-6]|uniref:nucleotidyltransferase family protein n=1 Tax=Phyllobacterium sp. 21LDTY02-6 TaxID=2944903 RepID=UPI002020E4EA|nr:nucleotidyltransferase family protein [Phyllobacterium sp. 21LDTY02-6]MCO4318049.1 nucleotidyltransferase family protein [Phyllobacterium sp. 21LDTY02-6]
MIDLPESHSTAVLVLGAGSGSRFHRDDKLGAELGGAPVAHHVLRTLQPFRWARKILVCRQSTDWTAAFREDGYSIVHNDAPEEGMLGSLRRGVMEASGLENVLVCLGDMPFIRREHIERLLSKAAQRRGQVVASRAGDHRGPPAIFPLSALAYLPASGEGGARSLLGEAAFVDCRLDEISDIDTQQDLADAEAHMAGTRVPVSQPPSC